MARRHLLRATLAAVVALTPSAAFAQDTPTPIRAAHPCDTIVAAAGGQTAEATASAAQPQPVSLAEAERHLSALRSRAEAPGITPQQLAEVRAEMQDLLERVGAEYQKMSPVADSDAPELA
jgi:hypothetical protein